MCTFVCSPCHQMCNFNERARFGFRPAGPIDFAERRPRRALHQALVLTDIRTSPSTTTCTPSPPPPPSPLASRCASDFLRVSPNVVVPFYVGPLTTRRASRYDPQAPSEFSRPKSAKAARAVNVTTKAAAADDKSSADGEESNFWKKVFLKDGEKEVSSGDYQKWQAELAAKKAANKEKAAAKEGGCVIM